MKRKNKVVLTSMATIALSTSLLVGGTYALFTSESKVNVAVTSGTVSMVASVKDGSVKTYSGAWDNASGAYVDEEQAAGAFANGGSATVFQDSNTIQIDRITPMDKVEFEIEVVNNSNVTVQYQTKVELVEGVDLFSALEISIDGKTYDGMTAYSDWATLVYDGNNESEVVDTIKVSIALPDDENNNDVQGKSVKLAYTVNAVQGNAHTEQPEADENTLYIYNANDMKLFAKSVNRGNTFSGKTVELMSNVDLENEEWTPIGNSSNAFSGTFDGNEKTVSNLKISGNKSYVGLFGYTTNGAVKNLTVKNADVSGRLGVGVVAGSPYTSTYDNISVVGDVKVNGMAYVGGVLGRNAYANVSNVTVNVNDGSYVKANSVENGVAYRTYVGGVIGFMGEGSHVVSNVVSNIDVIGSTCDVGGIVGIAHYGNSFVNCVSSGDVTVENTDPAEAIEIGGIAGVWNNGGEAVTFTNCSFTGTLTSVANLNNANKNLVVAPYSATGKGALVIDGKSSQLISDGFYLVTENKETYYEVTNANGMVAFEKSVNESKKTYAGEVVKLGCDIDLAGIDFEPIGQTGATEFKGTFDGQYYTISNLNIDSEAETGANYSSALFGWLENHSSTTSITIKNVNVDGANVKGHHNSAVIVGYATSNSRFVTISNCTVNNATVSCTYATNDADGDKAGVIIGNATVQNTRVINCSATNSTVSAGRDAGQIVGAGAEVNVIGCTAANVTVSANGTGTGANIREELIGRVLGSLVKTEVSNSETVVSDMDNALKAGEALQFTENVIVKETELSNGYGHKTAINQTNGGVIDGNGKTIKAEDSDCYTGYGSVIYTTGGTIKNLTIDGAFRSIFSAGLKEDLIIDNVTINANTYTFNSDGANAYDVIFTNSTLNGWTSYTGGYSSVSFTNCKFGSNGTYAYFRPYSETTLAYCEFSEDFEIDARQTEVVLTNCTVNGVLITEENVVELLGADAAKAIIRNS